MIGPSITLPYYKREDIQKAIVENAKGREVAIRFGDKGFGKRPDTLTYPTDILELAKQGATSFHASEELWNNPLRLGTNMRKFELDEIRDGWDLVIDIDCPLWSLSKITAWLIIKALKENGITSISIKFSGNKGFHIGVPFEVFPKKIGTEETRNKFPEAARKVAAYLLDFIGKSYIEVKADEIKLDKRFKVKAIDLAKSLNKSIDDLTFLRCRNCKKEVKTIEKIMHETVINADEIGFINESSYKDNVKKKSFTKKACGCNDPDYERLLNIEAIIDIDTILISSRHLYRMPYSLHEKSELASIPFNPEDVLNFKKEQANPKSLKVSKYIFLNRKTTIKGEGAALLDKALAFHIEDETQEIKTTKEYEIPTSALPEEHFPPCIKKILNGITDGKKRSLFTLVNFLNCVGWNYEQIEAKLKEWNNKNPEPLRDVLLLGQARYHKQQKKRVLPPNCGNKMYYKDIACCMPDNLCEKIKNPVNYTKRKVGYEEKTKKGERSKLTEEQKEMRRVHREKAKEQKR